MARTRDYFSPANLAQDVFDSHSKRPKVIRITRKRSESRNFKAQADIPISRNKPLSLIFSESVIKLTKTDAQFGSRRGTVAILLLKYAENMLLFKLLKRSRTSII